MIATDMTATKELEVLVKAVLGTWQKRECILNTDGVDDQLIVTCIYCKKSAVQKIENADDFYNAKNVEKAQSKLSVQVPHKSNCAYRVANRVNILGLTINPLEMM